MKKLTSTFCNVSFAGKYISALVNASFDFDVSIANDVAIVDAKTALPGEVMHR